MRRADCWIVENYEYRRAPQAAAEFATAASVHNHSSYSIENLASLDQVTQLAFMFPFRGTLKRAFGLSSISFSSYKELYYRPPLTPDGLLASETENAGELGFQHLLLGITDHDDIAGSLELLEQRGQSECFAAGEELSFRFKGHLFHLGISGLNPASAASSSADLHDAARTGNVDGMFELLRQLDCLVVLNHPLVPWGKPVEAIPVTDLLSRYGAFIDALEYNGMRGKAENDAVLKLAKHVGKPVIGGGDSHMLLSSSVLSLTNAATYRDFIEEVKRGRGSVLLTPMYFAPVNWKIFLRVLYFMGHYRRIAFFRGEPIEDLLSGRPILLDPVGLLARGFLNVTEILGWQR